MFVAAGIQTVTSILTKYRPDKDIDFVKHFCNKGLVSFGSKVKEVKPDYTTKFVKNEIEPIRKYRDVLEVYLDSGGYQVSTGQIPLSEIDKFTDHHISYMENYPDDFDYAFTLDIPNNPLYTETLDLNRNSLTKLYNSKVNLDKMMFVNHFRTITVFEVWNKLLDEFEVDKKFKAFSIGGLVVAQANVKRLPFMFYIVGFLMLLARWLQNNTLPSKFKFHILGNSTFKDVLFFCLLSEHVKNKFGSEMIITYDSSNLFKRFQQARSFVYFDQDKELGYEISAKELELEYKNGTGLTNLEVMLKEFDTMASIIGDNVDFSIPIYTNGKFSPQWTPYTLLLDAYEQIKFDNYVKVKAKELYSLYLHDSENFEKELTHVMSSISSKRWSKDILYRAKITKPSLELINEDIRPKTVADLVHTYSIVTDTEYLDMPQEFAL
jgi:hypothetical protein